MNAGIEPAIVRSLSAGLGQKGVRNHNERLLLSLLQRHGKMPGSDLAKLSGLSAPTIGAILTRLESDGLLLRGDPVRGKVGKPSVPMMLSPDGVLSFGLKLGRRSADLLLMDFTGKVRQHRHSSYLNPVPEDVFAFLRDSISDITAGLSPQEATRICGLGVAAPFELWNMRDLTGRDADNYTLWKDIRISDEVARFSALPVLLVNDSTAACQAEQVFGRGKEFRDYAYFFVGAYVGGGVVLNHSVFEGGQGNAGALGSLRSIGPHGESKQLIDIASIHLLEARLREVDLDPSLIWSKPQDWTAIARYVDPWLGQTAQELARASLSACSAIDFEAILIDGAFPPEIRDQLVERVRRYIVTQDTRGLIHPAIHGGQVGGNARAIGAASAPIFSQYLLNKNAGLAVA